MKRVNKTLLRMILLLIVIAFVSTYLVASSGYYEYQMQQKTILTSEQIKEFEEDIKNNNFIDVKDYYKKDDIDYTNKLTNLVYSISEGSSNLTRKVVKKIFKKLGSMIDE